MGAAITTGFGTGGWLFAIPLATIVVLGYVLVLSGSAGNESFRRGAVNYGVFIGLTVVTIVVGGFLDGTARVVAWLVAIGLFLIGTVRAGETDWTMRSGHFAERHGLIIIVALGEVIVAIAKPLVDTLEGGAIPTESVVSLAAAGVFSCVLWWSYFDRPQPAIEHKLEGEIGPEKSRLARDAYTYAHLPIVAGVIATAAALEEITLHPTDALPFEFRLMLVAGLALFLGGISAAMFRTFRVVATERFAAMTLIAVLVMAGGQLDGVILLVAVNLVLLVTLAVEHRRIEVVTKS